ncbi:SDR family NAD(P)-dependent oxidoreductase [Vibrio coralliilyticus]|uniref:SDR family NAD(P)-dependent oxidoreductase n=1 Tax=Vibrio coralliilyticus TaxID=190893 RepID=UPI003F56A383
MRSGLCDAQRLSRDGVTVILNYATNKTAAEEVAQEIQFNGGHAFLYQANISNPHAMAQMFDDIEQRHGPIDILVNSAGIMHLASLAEVDDEALSQQIATT